MIDGRADVFLEVICADVVCIHLRLSVIQRGAEIYSICLCINKHYLDYNYRHNVASCAVRAP